MRVPAVKFRTIKYVATISLFVALLCFLVFVVFSCGREQKNLSRAGQIKTGMTLREVYAVLGKPDVGFGLPQKGAEGPSWLYYKIPNDRYIVVNFVDDRVGDPPTSIEDRSSLVW